MSEEKDQQPDEAGFQPITSQEQLNKLIGGRIEAVKQKFADYDDLKSKASEYDKAQEAAKTELQKATERAEKAESRVAEFEQREQLAKWADEAATEIGVTASVLRGSTKEELLKHARLIKELTQQAPPAPRRRSATPPGKSPQDGGGSAAVEALRALRAQ